MGIVDNRRVTGYIVDADTGEMRGTIRSGDKFLPLRLYEPKEPGEYSRLEGAFIKLPASSLPVLQTLRLSRSEWACLWALCGKLRYNTGEVRHPNGRSLTVKWLSRQLGVTPLTAGRCLEALQRQGVLAYKSDRGKLAINLNPYLLHRGQVADTELCKRFAATPFGTAYMEGQHDGHRD